MMEQLTGLIEKAEIDMDLVSDSLKAELERFNAFQGQLLRIKGNDVEGVANEIDLREYMRYVVCNGTKEEKREVLAMII